MVLEQRKRTLYYRAPPPPPPPQWFWEQGEMTFCSSYGIKPTMKQVFSVRASQLIFPIAFNYSPKVLYDPLVALLGLALIHILCANCNINVICSSTRIFLRCV